MPVCKAFQAHAHHEVRRTLIFGILYSELYSVF
jgi:hypothetical protein